MERETRHLQLLEHLNVLKLTYAVATLYSVINNLTSQFRLPGHWVEHWVEHLKCPVPV